MDLFEYSNKLVKKGADFLDEILFGEWLHITLEFLDNTAERFDLPWLGRVSDFMYQFTVSAHLEDTEVELGDGYYLGAVESAIVRMKIIALLGPLATEVIYQRTVKGKSLDELDYLVEKYMGNIEQLSDEIDEEVANNKKMR